MTVFKKLLNDYRDCLLQGEHMDASAAYLALTKENASMQSRLEELEKESAALKKDAERYRWLREGNDAKLGAAWHVAVNLYGCEWDAAIDAAIAALGGKV